MYHCVYRIWPVWQIVTELCTESNLFGKLIGIQKVYEVYQKWYIDFFLSDA